VSDHERLAALHAAIRAMPWQDRWTDDGDDYVLERVVHVLIDDALAGVRVPAEPEAPDLRERVAAMIRTVPRPDRTAEEDAFLRGWDDGYRLAESRAPQSVPAPEPHAEVDAAAWHAAVCESPTGKAQPPSGDAPDLREALIAAILGTPMTPVKPTTGQLVDSMLAHPSVRAALADPVPSPTGSSSRELADLDVERLRAAYHAEYTSGDNRCEHGVRWDCRDRAEETVHWDRLARAYAEQDATPEGEA
jgi:hypothetical protein